MEPTARTETSPRPTPALPFSPVETPVLSFLRRHKRYLLRVLLTRRPCPRSLLREADGTVHAVLFSLYAECRRRGDHTFARLCDFTENERDAEAFARTVADGFVMPATLQDVFEDRFS